MILADTMFFQGLIQPILLQDYLPLALYGKMDKEKLVFSGYKVSVKTSF